MTLTDFLLDRIAEDEAAARSVESDERGGYERVEDHGGWIILSVDPARVLAECEAKRRIVELHKSWPVLVETPPTFEPIDASDPSRFAMRASQQIAWTTEQKYREQFGTEPPTGPILRALAAVYADHPDYDEEWKPMSERTAEKDAAVTALREAANDARAMHDPPAADCVEWADWLDARADRIEQAHPLPPATTEPK